MKFFILICVFALTGCDLTPNGQMTFSPITAPPPAPAPRTPPPETALPFSNLDAIKLSPGGIAAAGRSSSAAVTITMTNRMISGTQVSGKVSFSTTQAH